MQKILVIEDDRAIRGAIADILDLEGYHVLTAEDGITGVKMAREELPTLIICDIMMPFLDGYGVLAQLRKAAETATIPFIFLTARTTQDDVREGMNLGADDYLTKPFRAEMLLDTIRARIDRHTRLTERLHARMDELHSNLMNVLPHELNTPLHGILAGVDFLREEYNSLEPSDIEELLWIVHQSALRMRRLVANSLLHAELGATNAEIENETAANASMPLAVAGPIETVVRQEAEVTARAADVQMHLEDATVRIFPPHLNKIVEEIVNNALKYSKANTPIVVTSRAEGNLLRLSIEDHGRGMQEAEITKISAFQQFNRKHYEQQGLGLGLVIVQRLLALYAGSLNISSIPDEKTTVEIVLPLATS